MATTVVDRWILYYNAGGLIKEDNASLALGEEADTEDGRLRQSSTNLVGNDGKTILVPTYSRILLSK
jgi:hypothetical protein